MRIKFENGAEAEENLKKIADYPVGTIVEFIINGELYANEKYIGIILGTTKDSCVLYDVEEDCVYDDVENYSVVKVLDGYFTLKN